MGCKVCTNTGTLKEKNTFKFLDDSCLKAYIFTCTGKYIEHAVIYVYFASCTVFDLYPINGFFYCSVLKA